MGLSDLFIPAWNSKNEAKRLSVVKEKFSAVRLKMRNSANTNWNIAELFKIATKTKFEDVRQEIFLFIATEANHSWDREKAIKSLTDEAELISICRKQCGYMQSAYEVRKAGVENLMSRGAYEKVMRYSIDQEFRLAALERISDQSQLFSIIMDDFREDVKSSALRKLTDKTMLENVVSSSKERDIRLLAAIRLNNTSVIQEIYTDIARNEKDPQIRMDVAPKLDDKSLAQEVYADVVKAYDISTFNNTTNVDAIHHFTWEAWKNITDNKRLIDIAKNAKDFNWRLNAANKVTGLNLTPHYSEDASHDGMERERQRISEIFMKEISAIENNDLIE